MNFDQQASTYDQRVGLPPSIAKKIADAVVEVPRNLSQLHVLDIGAGTGEIGCELANLVKSYLAIDNSPGMLAQFRQRCQRPQRSLRLLVADGNMRWPIEPGQVNLIFSSRALHLLELDHVVQELNRLSQNHPLWLVIGRVHKEADSVPALMRKTMRTIMKAQGIKTKSGQNYKSKILQVLQEGGATIYPSLLVASWEKEFAPIQSLHAWRQKNGLAGTDISDEIKKAILDEVEARAKDHFEDLHKKQATAYHYKLNIARLHYTQSPYPPIPPPSNDRIIPMP